MKTTRRFWLYLDQFFSEWEMFEKNVVEEIKTHILYSVTFFLKTYRFWDNVEKYGRTGQATDDNRARRMRFAWWTRKTKDIHSEYEIIAAFRG